MTVDGYVEDAQNSATTNHRLNSLCLETIRQWSFAPEVRPSMHGKSRYPSSVIMDVMHAAAL